LGGLPGLDRRLRPATSVRALFVGPLVAGSWLIAIGIVDVISAVLVRHRLKA
jgi:hypothetical protein